jgi:hypothetical protein
LKLNESIDCGVSHITAEGVRDFITSRNPEAAAEVERIDYQFSTAECFEHAIKEDGGTLKGRQNLAGMEINGSALDTQSEVVKEIVMYVSLRVALYVRADEQPGKNIQRCGPDVSVIEKRRQYRAL